MLSSRRRRGQTKASLVMSLGLHGILVLILSFYVYTHREQIFSAKLDSDLVEVKQPDPRPRTRKRTPPPQQLSRKLRNMKMKAPMRQQPSSTSSLELSNRAVSVVVGSNDQPTDLIRPMAAAPASSGPTTDMSLLRMAPRPSFAVNMDVAAPTDFQAVEAALDLSSIANQFGENSLHNPGRISPDTSFTEFLTKVRSKIVRAQRYPRLAREKSLEGTATVRLKLYRDGSIMDITIVASSGSRVLDNAALAAVRSAAPFPPFSRKNEDMVYLEVPISFELVTG